MSTFHSTNNQATFAVWWDTHPVYHTCEDAAEQAWNASRESLEQRMRELRDECREDIHRCEDMHERNCLCKIANRNIFNKLIALLGEEQNP